MPELVLGSVKGKAGWEGITFPAGLGGWLGKGNNNCKNRSLRDDNKKTKTNTGFWLRENDWQKRAEDGDI
jgi:hypothetical protein